VGRIGIFDRGLGGLLVMKEIAKQLPAYDLVYLGDNLLTSAAAQPADELYARVQKAMAFLISQECELIIIASNTVASQSLRRLQQTYLPTQAPERRILSVIAPTAETAVTRTYSGNVGVIGSEGTVASGAFEREIHKRRPGVRVYQQSCPMLVQLIESGQQSSPTMDAFLRTYLAPLEAVHVDALILGSAQYWLIHSQITAILGPRVRLIDELAPTAEKLSAYLARHPEIDRFLNKDSERNFFCTSKKSFDLLAPTFYGAPVEAAQITL